MAVRIDDRRAFVILTAPGHMASVTGPYLRRIFVDELGVPAASVMNAVPKPDFGGTAALFVCCSVCSSLCLFSFTFYLLLTPFH